MVFVHLEFLKVVVVGARKLLAVLDTHSTQWSAISHRQKA